MSKKSFSNSTLFLCSVLCFASIGVIIWVIGTLFVLRPIMFVFVSGLYAVSALLLAFPAYRFWSRLKSSTERLLVALIAIMFCLSIPLLFLPEVGFDALWYHLPIIQMTVSSGSVFYEPQLYQSAMPRLGEMILAPAFAVGGVMGVKFMVWYGTLLLCGLVYLVARQVYSRPLSLLTVLMVLCFHVVQWQMSSAYVDQFTTLFFLCVFYGISQQKKSFSFAVLIGFFLALACATKLVALFFLPAYLGYALLKFGWKQTMIAFCTACVVYLPIQLQSYVWTGRFFFPLFSTIQAGDILTQQFQGGWFQWLILQALKLPFVSVLLTFNQESYTTAFFLFSFPLLVWWVWKYGKAYWHVLTFLFISLYTWLVIPPTSVRYGLASVIVLLIVSIEAVRRLGARHLPILRGAMLVISFSLILSSVIRFAVLFRSWPYLSRGETEEQYLSRFQSPIIKGPMEKWSSGYWKTQGIGMQ